MPYKIFPSLKELESELRHRPEWSFAMLDLNEYLVLTPETDEAEKLLETMEEHGYLPRTYSWISQYGRKERLYRRPQGISSQRFVVGDASLVFRTGQSCHPVAASPGRAQDYANNGDPAMLIAKPAAFPKKVLQLVQTMELLLEGMYSIE